ncbi:MAG: hypothetical protein GY778_09715, partial [bacterium]|nr:hypothetical protein [bacterium]
SERLLDLLGAAAPQSQPPSDQQAATTEPPAPAAALPELPDVKLVLRLAPQVVEGPGSEAKVAYGASLLPWPLNDASGEQPDNHGQAGLSWLVQLSPMVVDAEEAGVRVAYSASIRPLMEGAEKHQPPTPPQTASKPEGTWTHDLESPAVKAAAQAVRSCDAGQRYDKLLELIEAVQVGGHRG